MLIYIIHIKCTQNVKPRSAGNRLCLKQNKRGHRRLFGDIAVHQLQCSRKEHSSWSCLETCQAAWGCLDRSQEAVIEEKLQAGSSQASGSSSTGLVNSTALGFKDASLYIFHAHPPMFSSTHPNRKVLRRQWWPTDTYIFYLLLCYVFHNSNINYLFSGCMSYSQWLLK